MKAFLRRKTLASFDYQWEHLPTGVALLSDNYFREDAARILAEEEICMEPAWFRDKEVLDAGCGNGRWTYDFLKLGSRVTAFDASESACRAVRRQFLDEPRMEVIQADLLALPEQIARCRFDLAFAWGGATSHGGYHTGLDEFVPLG